MTYPASRRIGNNRPLRLVAAIEEVAATGNGPFYNSLANAELLEWLHEEDGSANGKRVTGAAEGWLPPNYVRPVVTQPTLVLPLP